MIQKMAITKARIHLGRVVKQVYLKKHTVILEKKRHSLGGVSSPRPTLPQT